MPQKSTAPTKSAPSRAPPEPTPARLLLRVHSGKQLQHAASSQGVYCKLYVGETAMIHGSQKSLFSRLSHSTDSTEADGEGAGQSHRIFRTRTVTAPAEPESVVLWDENFDVAVTDTAKDILSVRVKVQHRLYRSVVGACAIALKQLKIGRMVDKWVPVLKGSREVASLKLQILLSPVLDGQKSTERGKGALQADIKTALAANQSADEAIERLITSATSNRGGVKVMLEEDDENEELHEASSVASKEPVAATVANSA